VGGYPSVGASNQRKADSGQAAFSIGLGPVPFLLISELVPPPVSVVDPASQTGDPPIYHLPIPPSSYTVSPLSLRPRSSPLFPFRSIPTLPRLSVPLAPSPRARLYLPQAVPALSSLSLSCNWIANFFVALLFLPLRDALSSPVDPRDPLSARRGEGRVFYVFTLVCAGLGMLVWRGLPRRSGSGSA
jgi:hypothetical protein